MKKIHILGIVVIAVAIGVIFTSLQSSATYSDFAEAFNNPDTEYHVVGKLDKAIPVQYDPKINADVEFPFIYSPFLLCPILTILILLKYSK